MRSLFIGFFMLLLFFGVVFFLGPFLRRAGSAGNTVVLLSALACAVFVARYSKFGILLFVFFITYTSFGIPGLPFHVMVADVLLVFLVFGWIVRLVLRFKTEFHPLGYETAFFLLFFFTFIGLPEAHYPNVALASTIQTLQYLFVMPLFINNNVDSREEIDQILGVLLFTSTVAGLLAGVQYYFGQARVVSVMSHFNEYGGFLAVVVPLCFALFHLERWPTRKFVNLIVLILQVLATLFTLSRGAWVAVGAALLFIALVSDLTVLFALVAASFLLLSLGYGYMPRAWMIRYDELLDFDKHRRIQYSVAFRMISEKPVLGVGISNANPYSVRYRGELFDRGVYGAIHNLYLMIGAERGLIAMGALIAILMKSLIRAVRNYKSAADPGWAKIHLALAAGLFGFMVNNFSGFHFHRGPGLVVGLVLGLIAASDRIMKQQMQQKEAVAQSRRLRRMNVNYGAERKE